MQESLLKTVKEQNNEQKINVEEMETLLNSNIEEVVSLCKKACLKPKTDKAGRAYFTRQDFDLLKKVKALYNQSRSFEEEKNKIEKAMEEKKHDDKTQEDKIEFLEKAKARVKTPAPLVLNPAHPVAQLASRLEVIESNLITKMGELLSEKMDGFDEIIVELVRAKTENENLRQQVNSLNKQVFILKNELASFNALPFGFYTKKDTDN